MIGKAVTGVVLDESVRLSVIEVCELCCCRSEWVADLVAYGIVEPTGQDLDTWQFRGDTVNRIFVAQRLQRDLKINTAGIALVLDLLDEMSELRARLKDSC